MSETCPKCGLSKEFCVCEAIAKEKEKIRVYSVKRRFGKIITIVDGLSKDVDIKKILKDLKQSLACGGTLKDNTIELQGEHKERVKKTLIKLGFSEDQIDTN